MTRWILAAALATAAMTFAHPAQAAGYAPWCAVIALGRGNTYWDCQYASIEQCRPVVVAGNRGFCNPNPAYVAEAPVKRRHKHHWR